jgi:hypothetical protein
VNSRQVDAEQVVDHRLQIVADRIFLRDDGPHGMPADDFRFLVTEKVQSERVERFYPPLAVQAQNDAAGVRQRDGVGPRTGFKGVLSEIMVYDVMQSIYGLSDFKIILTCFRLPSQEL